jgi:Sulfatase-modifying factor enzyme 1
MRVTRNEQLVPGATRFPGFPGFLAMAMAALLGLGFAAASTAHAGPTPSYGLDFVTIGDPGNRNVNIDEGRRFFPPYASEGFTVGQVNYRYRMARTELTVGKWLEFVNSYAPYYDGPVNDSSFTSQWIWFDNQTGQYSAVAGSENYAADMSWRYAARYANWLHNNKGLDQASFESGAYDTSTFGRDGDGNYTDQRERSPGARFWIPNLDEWTKAMHWDPGMNNGEGGYWRYPHSSNLEPVVGPPGQGETNAATGQFYDVGAYADVMSPWGLFDGSGGEREWVEAEVSESGWRYLKGTSWALGGSFDEIDRVGFTPPVEASGGLRLVSVIPSPGVISTIVILGAISTRKRR